MNSKNNSAKAQKNITRKEWRRNKRRMAFLRKKENKLAIATKNNAEEKRYDVHAEYHETLNKMVRKVIEENKIKYSILTDYYFICTNLSKEECDALQEKFKGCVIVRTDGHRNKTIRFSRWKSKTIISNSKEPHTHTNNTKEVSSAARTARKAKNIAKHPKFTKHANNDKKKRTKENPIPTYGRNAKKMTFRYGKHKFKSIAKVTPALKETSLAKKLRQRAQKAGKYLINKEKKASQISVKKSNPRKPLQQKFKFAA